MKSKKLEKLLFGRGPVTDPWEEYEEIRMGRINDSPGTIESPNTALAQNDIMRTNAVRDSNKGIHQVMDAVGGFALNTGMSMMTKGLDSKLSGLIEKPEMKYGGSGNGKMVEVEGKEVIDRPGSGLFEADGPSHKKGGIDTFLNNEDTVFSTQISDENGTMAEKKKKREKRMSKLEKLLEDNSTDTLLKNTQKRTKQVNTQEEKEDLMLQTLVGIMKGENPTKEDKAYGTSFLESLMDNKDIPKMANGSIDPNILASLFGNEDGPFPTNLTGTTEDFHSGNPEIDYRTTPLSVGKLESQGAEKTKLKGAMIPDNTQASGNVMSNKEGFNLDMLKDLELPTAGDALGLYAQFKGMNAPMKNTLNMRAGDTPNINAFEDFGKDGLKTIQESKGYVDQNKESLESDLELSRRSQMKRNANSARGVNTKRALDLATSAGANENRVKIGNQANNQMMQILAQEGQMENMQDKVVMGGEQSRDQRDRQDRDNFYSQMATDLATKFETMQGVGKNLNSIKGRGDNKDMIDQLVSASENSNSIRELLKAMLKMNGKKVNVKDS